MSKYRPFAVVLAAALLIGPGSMVIAEQSQEAAEQAQTDISLSAPQIAAMKDSLFAVINSNYQTVKPIFQHSCFDCHSQNTKFPWYHKIPIIKGMLDSHVKEGREYLDLSNDFPFSGKEEILKLLDAIKEEIEDGKMPLWSYRLMHWGTAVKGAQQDSVVNWIDSSAEMLIEFYELANMSYEFEDKD